MGCRYEWERISRSLCLQDLSQQRHRGYGLGSVCCGTSGEEEGHQHTYIRTLNSCVDIRRRLLYTLCVARKLTAVRLKEEHIKQLAEEAQRQDVPVSHLIRLAVAEFLEKVKDKKKQ